MITKMAKLELVGPKKHLLPTVDAIHQFGRFHVASTRFTDLPEFATVEEPELDPERVRYKGKLDELLKGVDALMALLNETPGIFGDKAGRETAAPGFQDLSDDIIEENTLLSRELASKIKGLVKKKLDLKDELEFTRKFQRVTRAFVPLVEEIGKIRDFGMIGFTMKKKKKDVLAILREELDNITGGQFEIFTRELDENTLAGIVSVPRDYLRQAKRLFVSERISELRLPETLGDESPIETLQALSRRLEEIPHELEALDEEIKALSDENYPAMFRQLRASIEDRISEMDTLSQVARTAMTFILIGWLPDKYIDEFMDFARENFDPSIIVAKGHVEEGDVESGEVPVIIENPPLIKPFEICLKLFPKPKYSNIDPTPFLAIFFPIFFGLILGDIFYGLIILALSIFVHYKFREYALAHPISVIMFACATSTILFGILFGEFLGDIGHRWGMQPILFNRETALVPSMALALAMGVSHIFFGILLKAYTSFKWKHYGHAVEAPSTIVIVVAISVLLVYLAGFLPPVFKHVSTVALIVAIPLMVAGGGLISLLEVFTVFGSILSYARIMAIGLSSVILAVVANKLAGEFGNINIVLGVIIAAMIHLINLILGMFGPTIHGLRLHYVEFFGKFYQTGSVEYKPLTKKSRPQATAQEGR